MNRSLIATLTLLLVSPVSTVARAQDMSFDLDEAETEAEAGGEADMSFGADEDDAEGEGEGDDDTMDLIGELADEDDSDVLGGPGGDTGPRPTEVVEEIYAVQQIYALRKRRLELLPMVGFSVNDPYVSHPSVGAGLNYWITNVLAVGANFNWYQGFENEKDLNFQVRRSTRLATRPTNYQVGFWGNFAYVPFYGKFSVFRKKIFQWDSYLIGGVGAMRTKPVVVVDPAFRSFDYDFRIGFHVGLGIRIFLTKWMTVFTEVRNYMFLDKLENLDVSLTDRENPDTWLEDSSTFVNNVTVHVGLTLFFPFTFEYDLPK